MREAAGRLALSSTALSDFINGKQAATLEQLIALADYFQLSLDDAARMDGRCVTVSASPEDRHRRLLQMSHYLPKSARILSALETFDDCEIDYLLTTIEVIEARRRQDR